jgi:hypothetical protein
VAKPAHTPSPAAASDANTNLSSAATAPYSPAAESPTPACPPTTVTSTVPSSPSSHVPRAARRAVLERDILGCSWQDAHGVRCASRAWLEIDHHHPAGKGGGSDPDNLRLLCRAHNQLAAEHAYGRKHMERALARRRKMEPRLHPCSEGQAGRHTR